MGWILFLLLIWFVVSTSKKNTRRNKSRTQQQSRPASPMDPKRDRQIEEMLAHMGAQKAAGVRNAQTGAGRKRQGAAAARSVPAVQSPAEAAVPVSAVVQMPPRPAAGAAVQQNETEGETEKEHAAHAAREEARDAAHRKLHAEYDRKVDARRKRMREAVVMKEVLDRPVSLREGYFGSPR